MSCIQQLSCTCLSHSNPTIHGWQLRLHQALKTALTRTGKSLRLFTCLMRNFLVHKCSCFSYSAWLLLKYNYLYVHTMQMPQIHVNSPYFVNTKDQHRRYMSCMHSNQKLQHPMHAQKRRQIRNLPVYIKSLLVQLVALMLLLPPYGSITKSVLDFDLKGLACPIVPTANLHDFRSTP